MVPKTIAAQVALAVAVGLGGAAPCFAAEPVDFAREIAPVLERSCIRCHQPNVRKGELSLATSADLIDAGYVVRGEPDQSHLLSVLVPAAPGERPQMPKEGAPLSAEEIALVREWIAQGAHWPDELVLSEKSKADKKWWSLQPLAEVEPPHPEGIQTTWGASPIDRFLFEKLKENGLEPSPPADRRALIRRVTYDLTGLPPAPDEVEAFLHDERPDAYERLVDRLLESPHYGEHWGRHWLDVARFGESRGFERNEIITNAWPFRDYVIRSLNDDKPFNQLVREHLAGDVIGRDRPEVEVGTTFLVCGPYDDVGNQDPVQAARIRANTIDDMIRATSEAFLGLTVGCARCHDHKFDPIAQRDYYSLYATFAGVRHGPRTVATADQRQTHAERLAPLNRRRERLSREKSELEETIFARAEQKAEMYASRETRPAIDRKGTEETFAPVEARYVRLLVEGRDTDPYARSGHHIDEFEIWTAEAEPRNVALSANGGQAAGSSRVAEDFADAYSPALTIDGEFGARWIGGGPELTITLEQPATINRILFSSDRTGAAGDNPVAAFVSEYRIEVSLDGERWTEVADSYDRRPVSPAHRRKRFIQAEITSQEREQLATFDSQLGEVQREIAAVPSLPAWWVGNFETAAGPFHVFLGGDPQKKGPEIVPASLSTLDQVTSTYELSAGASEAERRLALAEWIVHLENPLTPRVLANRIWHYHFGTGIVDTPSDFGYMGGRPSHPQLLDWLARQVHENGWRLKPLHRLIVTSQAYRQSAAHRPEAAQVDAESRLLWRFPPRRLAAEEIRDTLLSISGKLDPTMGGPGFRLYRYLQDNVATYIPHDEHGPETYRRAVYHHNARALQVDLLTDFDCPDNAFAAPRRASTVTPLQALTLMNHSFSVDMAAALAERLCSECGPDAAKQLERTFLLCCSRTPDETEQAAAIEFIERQGLRAFCRAMLNSNELIYLD